MTRKVSVNSNEERNLLSRGVVISNEERNLLCLRFPKISPRLRRVDMTKVNCHFAEPLSFRTKREILNPRLLRYLSHSSFDMTVIGCHFERREKSFFVFLTRKDISPPYAGRYDKRSLSIRTKREILLPAKVKDISVVPPSI